MLLGNWAVRLLVLGKEENNECGVICVFCIIPVGYDNKTWCGSENNADMDLVCCACIYENEE